MLGGAIVLILIYSFSTPDTQAQRLADIVRGDIAFALMAIAVAIFCVTLAMNPELAALISLVFQRSKLLTITAFGITGLIALMLTVVVLALTSALLQARYGVLLSVLLVGAALFNFALLAVEPSKLIGYPIIIVTALALSWVGITLKVASWYLTIPYGIFDPPLLTQF